MYLLIVHQRLQPIQLGLCKNGEMAVLNLENKLRISTATGTQTERDVLVVSSKGRSIPVTDLVIGGSVIINL